MVPYSLAHMIRCNVVMCVNNVEEQTGVGMDAEVRYAWRGVCIRENLRPNEPSARVGGKQIFDRGLL